jgi:large subunit ribosomal protein L29
MKQPKMKDLGDQELATQLRDMEEKLFRIRFQMSMGQTEGLKKLRVMKKDKARLLTIQRERELAAGKKA